MSITAHKNKATKLTLKLDKSIIERGKLLAKDRNLSLSKLVENYLRKELAAATAPPPCLVVEPDADIIAIMASSGAVAAERPATNREQYDDYARRRYARYLENSAVE